MFGSFFWGHWLVLGFVFGVAELFFPAFILIWFASGAAAVALLVALLPDIPFAGQIFLWTSLSLVMVWLWFHFFGGRAHKSLTGRASAEIVGEVGLAVEDLAPFRPGHVRFQRPLLGSDLWECNVSAPLAAGTRVAVLAVEGNRLLVGPEKKEPILNESSEEQGDLS